MSAKASPLHRPGASPCALALNDHLAMVRVNVAEPVPAALVALSVTLNVPPDPLAVPEIRPVDVLTDRPPGKPVALKLVGLLVAVI